MSKELELIEQALAEAYVRSQGPRGMAAHVVSVLAERGYSIVRLPELLPLGHEFRGIGHSCTKGLPGRRLCGESETAHLPTAAIAEEDANG